MLKSIERRAGVAGALRGSRPRRALILAAAGAFMVVLIMSAAPGHAAGSKNTAKYWKGKNISEATKVLGEPTQMTPLPDTGGTLYIYAHHGEQHWVFETQTGGKIVKAAKVE